MSAAKTTTPTVYKITVFKDAAGEYRWHMKAPNGRIVADSGEGYKRRGGAVAAAQRLVDADVQLVQVVA